MVDFVPVTSLYREDCEFLHQTYKVKKSMGKGTKAYQVCNKKSLNCGYVLKIISYDQVLYEMSGGSISTLDQIRLNWIHEVTVMKKLNECQKEFSIVFSPILYDSWVCSVKDKVHFYILMEKYDGDIKQFIDLNKKDKMLNVAVIKSLESLYLSLVIIHSNANICLNDIKLKNILYKQVGNYTYQFVFADFGLSFLETNESCKKEDRERFKRTIDRFTERIEQT